MKRAAIITVTLLTLTGCATYTPAERLERARARDLVMQERREQFMKTNGALGYFTCSMNPTACPEPHAYEERVLREIDEETRRR